MFTYGLRKKTYVYGLRPAYWALNLWRQVIEVSLMLNRVIKDTLQR